MAILVNTETNTGLTLDAGYFRLTSIRIEERADMRHPMPYERESEIDSRIFVSFSGALYASQEARESGKIALDPSYYNGHIELSNADKSASIYELVYLHITELAKNNSTEQKLFGKAVKV